MMKYHMMAFVTGFILDLIFGDPYWMPHPIRLIGNTISRLEKKLYKETNQFLRGAILAILMMIFTVLASGAVLFTGYKIHPFLGLAIESIMTYQILAMKCLKVESMKVYDKLKNSSLEEARKAVSMIVGRDTNVLDKEGVIKAAVETVAENASDGVIAPMIYLAIGGPVLGFLYKAVNTMDSMIGYKNERYLAFGTFAARTDDVLNYVPARISALLMIFAAFTGGKDLDGKKAYQIWRRDRRNHASPNSAQTESVCAGALQVKLAGDASYFGKIVKKKSIGDAIRKVEIDDIRRANHLMYLSAFYCELICLIIMAVITLR